jgi:hypothetical protein
MHQGIPEFQGPKKDPQSQEADGFMLIPRTIFKLTPFNRAAAEEPRRVGCLNCGYDLSIGTYLELRENIEKKCPHCNMTAAEHHLQEDGSKPDD